MQSTEQKLREAVFTVLEGCTLNHDVRKILEAAYYAPEALALPTAEQVGDINVAESFTSVTKTAPPVGERERFEDLIEEFEAAAIDKHDCRNPEYEFEHRAYDSACQRYDEARSALSAGDAVDAGKFHKLFEAMDEGRASIIVEGATESIDGGEIFTDIDDALDAIDSAMRKGQL